MTCKCKVVWSNEDGPVLSMKHCSLHRAAEAMLEALRTILPIVDESANCEVGDCELCAAVRKIKSSITEATNGN